MFHAHSALAAILAAVSVSSFALADNTWYVDPTVTAGTGLGTIASPYGSVQQAFNSAWQNTGIQTISLPTGNYSGAHLGNTGWLNLDNGGTTYGAEGAQQASKIVFQGTGNTSTIFSFLNATDYTADYGMIRTRAGVPQGIYFNNIGFDTTPNASNFGSAGLVGQDLQEVYGGPQITFANDNIVLGITAATAGSAGELGVHLIGPQNDNWFTFDNSTIHLAVTNYIGTVYNGVTNPADYYTPPFFNLGAGNTLYDGIGGIFNGNGNSLIYNPGNVLVSDIAPLYVTETNGNNLGNIIATYGGLNITDGVTAGHVAGNFLQNFGTGVSAPPPTVPEPATLAVVSLGGLTLLARKRRTLK